MMKSLAFYCPLSTHSLLGKLVWMQHFNQRLTYIIRPCRSRVDGVCVRAFVGRVRAYFTQNHPTNPACFQKVWARGASPLPSPPATAGFQGSPVSQYFWGGYLIPFFWVSLALFGPPSCRCCFWDAPILLPLSPVMSSLLREEMQRVLFRPAKERLVEFIEIEEPTHGRHFFCASGKQLDCWLRNMCLIFTQE